MFANLPVNVLPSASAEAGDEYITDFSTGMDQAVAIYTGGAADARVKVTIPKGVLVSSASVDISGASAQGWNSIVSDVQKDWEAGSSVQTDTHSDSLTLGFARTHGQADLHDLDSSSANGTSAVLGSEEFAIRQPRSGNVTEGLLAQQRMIQPTYSTMYSGGILVYRGWGYVSSFTSSTFNRTIDRVYLNNFSRASAVTIDVGTCSVPALTYTWSAYGFRDFAVDDEEHVYGILQTYRTTSTPSANEERVIKFDIRDPNHWRCIAVYDPSSGGQGSYSGIAFDRDKQVVWLAHDSRKQLIGYYFRDDGAFDRVGETGTVYSYSAGQVCGLEVIGDRFFFRSYSSWRSDILEVWEVSGTSTALARIDTTVTISQNGVGLYYDGHRIWTMDHYNSAPWYVRNLYEFGTGIQYQNPSTASPSTTEWISPTVNRLDPVIAVAPRLEWSANTAGDSVEYFYTADGGLHWTQILDNSTTHLEHSGLQTAWKARLIGQSATSWWLELDHASAYHSTGTWTSVTKTTTTQIGAVRPEWIADVPANTTLSVEVSNDGGSTWHSADNGANISFEQTGRQLAWRVSMGTNDSNMTPFLKHFELHYLEGFPKDIYLDVDDNGVVNWAMTGLLNAKRTIAGEDFVDALNDAIPDNGAGTVDLSLAVGASSPGRIKMSNLSIRYEVRTHVVGASLDGGILVPDDEWRILKTHVQLGAKSTQIETVHIELENSHGPDPSFEWRIGDICSDVSDVGGVIDIDSANCTSYLNVDRLLEVRVPVRSTWQWDDESGVEANISVDDNLLDSIVDNWHTEYLDLRVENDVRLDGLRVTDISGRELVPLDWTRGGLDLQFEGTLTFDQTSLSPKAGEFNLSVTGVNLTRDGDPLPGDLLEEKVRTPNPSFGGYSLTVPTPIESSAGGMLFTVVARDFPSLTSDYSNPKQNTIRLVLDGNSPLVIDTWPYHGSEMKASVSQPLSIVLQDGVEPPERISVHYWVESAHDDSGDGLPQENEYETIFVSGPETLPGGILNFSTTIDDHLNGHGDKVVLHVSGQDAQGNGVAMGGNPVCPPSPALCVLNADGLGLDAVEPNWDAPLAIYTNREEMAPMLDISSSQILGHVDGDPLHPGIPYDLVLNISDGNRWEDIQKIRVSLTGDFDDIDGVITIDPHAKNLPFSTQSATISVSNLYSVIMPQDATTLLVRARLIIGWALEVGPSSQRTILVEITDNPCTPGSKSPCHTESTALGSGSWVYDRELRFDNQEGRFTAIELSTRRDLFATASSNGVIIGAGQVLRVEGRILFAKDDRPAPSGIAEIVISDATNRWSTRIGDDGVFTIDILVPPVDSGRLDLRTVITSLPARDAGVTISGPRILLIVDSTPPRVDALQPDASVLSVRDASAYQLLVETLDDVGFNALQHPSAHWRIRAGSSTVSLGTKSLELVEVFSSSALWTTNLDFTSEGDVRLLEGYTIDLWFTGADLSGNPLSVIGNSESEPFRSLIIIRDGPEIDLDALRTEWSDPSPIAGSTSTLTVQGHSLNEHNGSIRITLQQSLGMDGWFTLEIREVDIEAATPFEAGFQVIIPSDGQGNPVDEKMQFRILIYDRHMPLGEKTIAPLLPRSMENRDLAAFNEQVDANLVGITMYVITLISIGFAVFTLVVNRRLRSRSELSEEDDGTVPPDSTPSDPVMTPGAQAYVTEMAQHSFAPTPAENPYAQSQSPIPPPPPGLVSSQQIPPPPPGFGG